MSRMPIIQRMELTGASIPSFGCRSMTVLFCCRVQKPLLTKANAVTQALGSSTAEMFRIFVAEIARTGRVPVSLNTSGNDNRNNAVG